MDLKKKTKKKGNALDLWNKLPFIGEEKANELQ